MAASPIFSASAATEGLDISFTARCIVVGKDRAECSRSSVRTLFYRRLRLHGGARAVWPGIRMPFLIESSTVMVNKAVQNLYTICTKFVLLNLMQQYKICTVESNAIFL